MSEEVSITTSGGVVEIRLNRPAKKNSLTGPMYAAMTDALTAGCAASDVRAFVISAEGPAFCAGNDIGDFLHPRADDGDSPAWRFVTTIADCSKPIVAAVGGHAIGVGTTMLLHCDLVYAGPAASFSVPFVNLGLVPEAGSSMLLPALLGQARAARLLLLGEALTAAEAQAAGLVGEIVAAERLDDYARGKAAKLAAAPPQALAATRALLRGDRAPLRTHMQAEIEAFARAVRGPEAREAFTAFLEKRPANFAADSVRA